MYNEADIYCLYCHNETNMPFILEKHCYQEKKKKTKVYTMKNTFIEKTKNMTLYRPLLFIIGYASEIVSKLYTD